MGESQEPVSKLAAQPDYFVDFEIGSRRVIGAAAIASAGCSEDCRCFRFAFTVAAGKAL
jgi:hypothetical protein